jgi:FAD:protein FMN transferase
VPLPRDTPWTKPQRHCRKPELILTSFSLSGKAVANSDDYQKYFNHESTHYYHNLNPKIGYPVTGMTYSTVVTHNVMDTDTLSTALFVMGTKKGLAFIDSLKNTKGLIVHQNKNPQLSQSMENLANFSLESFKENFSY